MLCARSLPPEERSIRTGRSTKAFEVGDKATGTHVLTELYEQMRDTPKPVDLDALWKELGVERDAEGVRLDDSAPFANIRKAITVPPRG